MINSLQKMGLYEDINIIITSDHGMDTANEDKSIDLSDYVDISKFRSYGGLTQINIFPNNRKIFFFF
jgi:predicted AlkP superfamily pyrophosphatase or phosphodiesterase